jgi:TBC1 domain family protein 5
VSPLPIYLQFAIHLSSRSFPDIGYFRDDDVQQQLTNILFLYAVMHPDIEYRQGMHELLAPVYYAVGM